jgi:hypothetical protein
MFLLIEGLSVAQSNAALIIRWDGEVVLPSIVAPAFRSSAARYLIVNKKGAGSVCPVRNV